MKTIKNDRTTVSHTIWWLIKETGKKVSTATMRLANTKIRVPIRCQVKIPLKTKYIYISNTKANGKETSQARSIP